MAVTIENTEDGKNQLVRIAENTNSQSPVLPSDLKSNDRVQSAIQANFKALAQPWFYERKRKEWQTLSRSERAPFNGRRLCMGDVGQRWRAFTGQPAQSITDKEELFTNSAIYGDVFRRDRDAREHLFACLLFDDLDFLLTENKRASRLEVAGADFDTDHLNRVLRAKKLWVAQMVALIAQLIIKIYESRDAEVLRKLLDLLQNNPTALNQMRVWSIGVFKQWCRSLTPDYDLRKELKDIQVATRLINILEDQIRMNGGLGRVRELFPKLQ